MAHYLALCDPISCHAPMPFPGVPFALWTLSSIHGCAHTLGGPNFRTLPSQKPLKTPLLRRGLYERGGACKIPATKRGKKRVCVCVYIYISICTPGVNLTKDPLLMRGSIFPWFLLGFSISKTPEDNTIRPPL